MLLNCFTYSPPTFLTTKNVPSKTAEGRELHSGFGIPAFCRTEQALQEHLGKRRQRHHPGRIAEPRQAGRVYPAGFSKLLGWQKPLCCWISGEQAGRAMPEEPSWLLRPPAQAAALLSNHPDNGTPALLQFIIVIIFFSHLLHITDIYSQLSPQLDYLY